MLTYPEPVEERRPQLPNEEQPKKAVSVLRFQIESREPIVESDAVPDEKVTDLRPAKGVSDDHVYVIGAFDEALPGEKRDDYHGSISDFEEEQRRLFYVSITRPKSTSMFSIVDKIER